VQCKYLFNWVNRACKSTLDPASKDDRTLFYSTPDALAKTYGVKAEAEKDRLDRMRADQVEYELITKAA